ncbi:MAG: bifunctional phosphopantothenoylcysteine decarboxylase/phosphopantothenate--cysteine ligase CoaBC [Promethearchaeota archaeon]
MWLKHPSKDIVETRGTSLRGKSICLCLTGSVAVMSVPVLAREFMRMGAEVHAVMSRAATGLISPELIHWATGNPVITKLTGAVEHIALAGERPEEHGQADLILVCPATANTISKIACGIDDTPVTTVVTTAFGSGTPIVVVPAMHESMFRHPILEEHLLKLQRLGVDILGPRISEGKAKIAKIDDIVSRVRDILISKKDLEGLRFLLTVGPTREYIDEVRFISNPSSGKMGMAIAEEILARGGKVTIINGKSLAKSPLGARVINAITTQDFYDRMVEELEREHYDFFISAAAISDYTPRERIREKISSDFPTLCVDLVKTPKIISKAREISEKLFIVAFKAEVNQEEDALIERAFNRLASAGTDLIVANDVGRERRGFETTTNEVYIIDRERNVTHVPLKDKRYIATKIIDCALENYRANNAKA